MISCRLKMIKRTMVQKNKTCSSAVIKKRNVANPRALNKDCIVFVTSQQSIKNRQNINGMTMIQLKSNKSNLWKRIYEELKKFTTRIGHGKVLTKYDENKALVPGFIHNGNVINFL
mmetsp:Transcript_61813/g.73290  ORF Transcript_61813/g.73290 Transcript_61813/m.73290 type:complete len:116 (-) Transcript_61813:118-465(-)